VYASELARLQKLDKEEQSQAQTGGILYNLGQIILSFINPEQSKNIIDFCRAKGFSIATFDELTNAINPTEVGYRIAQKWDFPEDLVNIIRHQNQPQLAEPKLQHIVCIIHLAGSLLSVEHELLSYFQINTVVLKALGLTDLEKLEELHNLIKANYEKVLGTS
jgi:HD-like signal output (HDOD) protein